MPLCPPHVSCDKLSSKLTFDLFFFVRFFKWSIFYLQRHSHTHTPVGRQSNNRKSPQTSGEATKGEPNPKAGKHAQNPAASAGHGSVERKGGEVGTKGVPSWPVSPTLVKALLFTFRKVSKKKEEARRKHPTRMLAHANTYDALHTKRRGRTVFADAGAINSRTKIKLTR